ncbi:hypothetical protein KEM55_008017 [Ascosphaera atra]|nr:hypothetical protein KEM55_008017 [Ascosphaera atra]
MGDSSAPKSYPRVVGISIPRTPWTAKFCDLKIVCGEAVFEVHKIIACSSSPSIASVLDKDGSLNVVAIQDSEPEVVEKVIDYMYTAVYQYQSGAAKSSPDAVNDQSEKKAAAGQEVVKFGTQGPTPESSKPGTPDSHPCTENEGDQKQQGCLSNAGQELLFHARVCCLADRLGILTLRDFARGKVSAVLEKSFMDAVFQFKEFIELCFNHSTDKELQGLAIKHAVAHYVVLDHAGAFPKSTTPAAFFAEVCSKLVYREDDNIFSEVKAELVRVKEEARKMEDDRNSELSKTKEEATRVQASHDAELAKWKERVRALKGELRTTKDDWHAEKQRLSADLANEKAMSDKYASQLNQKHSELVDLKLLNEQQVNKEALWSNELENMKQWKQHCDMIAQFFKKHRKCLNKECNKKLSALTFDAKAPWHTCRHCNSSYSLKEIMEGGSTRLDAMLRGCSNVNKAHDIHLNTNS